MPHAWAHATAKKRALRPGTNVGDIADRMSVMDLSFGIESSGIHQSILETIRGTPKRAQSVAA